MSYIYLIYALFIFFQLLNGEMKKPIKEDIPMAFEGKDKGVYDDEVQGWNFM